MEAKEARVRDRGQRSISSRPFSFSSWVNRLKTRRSDQRVSVEAGPSEKLQTVQAEPATAAQPTALPSPLVLEPCWLDQANRPEIRRIATLPSETVEMKPLGACSQSLSTIDIHENTPHQPWHQTSFTSCAPALYEIDDAIVHGAVGITGFADRVIAETLWHTATDRHRYTQDGAAYLLTFDRIERLPGRHASILTGAAESYWHAVFDATARLGIIPADIWIGIDGLLIPSTGVRQEELVALYGVPPQVHVRVVKPHESFSVDTLVLPSSMHIMFDYHPRLVDAVYDRILASAQPPSSSSGRRIFVDRRGSGLRRLVNEDAVIEALTPLGFEPVKLEGLTVAEQATIFYDAEIIVAPHGAGLTNIGFARAGTTVIELMMDAYLNWCYRRIAAIRNLDYDCVIGRSQQPVSEVVEVIHWRTWTIDPGAVIEFVEAAIARKAG